MDYGIMRMIYLYVIDRVDMMQNKNKSCVRSTNYVKTIQKPCCLLSQNHYIFHLFLKIFLYS